LKFIGASKIKFATAGVLLAGAVGTTLVVQTHNQLRGENRGLRQQLAQLAADAENSQRASSANKVLANGPLTKDQFDELLRLRGEVALLRKATNELEKMRLENLALASQSKSNSANPFPNQAPERWLFTGGEVKFPNRYLFVEGSTVLRAIAAAGGITDQGSMANVQLRRKNQQPLVLDLQQMLAGKAEDPQLQPDDVVFVPRE